MHKLYSYIDASFAIAIASIVDYLYMYYNIASYRLSSYAMPLSDEYLDLHKQLQPNRKR